MSQDAAARNRARFPAAAAFVDEMRAAFGPDVRLIFAEENGETVGTPAPAGVVPVIWKKTPRGDE